MKFTKEQLEFIKTQMMFSIINCNRTIQKYKACNTPTTKYEDAIKMAKSIYDVASYEKDNITFIIIDIIKDRNINGITKILTESNPDKIKIDISIPSTNSDDNILIRTLLLEKYYTLSRSTKGGLKIGDII